jgi:hypothetical protein
VGSRPEVKNTHKCVGSRPDVKHTRTRKRRAHLALPHGLDGLLRVAAAVPHLDCCVVAAGHQHLIRGGVHDLRAARTCRGGTTQGLVVARATRRCSCAILCWPHTPALLTALMRESWPLNLRITAPEDTSHKNTCGHTQVHRGASNVGIGTARAACVLQAGSDQLRRHTHAPLAHLPVAAHGRELAVVGGHGHVAHFVAVALVRLDEQALGGVPQPQRAVLVALGCVWGVCVCVGGGGGGDGCVASSAGVSSRDTWRCQHQPLATNRTPTLPQETQ